ncbi:MAG: hypothetical protein M0C28_14150 [Candidatus Moduliflexus flocculans]|nr:hypothetical protein [Candidatus Moduliflexus flocculans]
MVDFTRDGGIITCASRLPVRASISGVAVPGESGSPKRALSWSRPAGYRVLRKIAPALDEFIHDRATSPMEARNSFEEFSLLGGPLYRLGQRMHLFRGVTDTVMQGLALGVLLWGVLVALAFFAGVSDRLFSLGHQRARSPAAGHPAVHSV